ncbi:phage tail tape measure protein [Ruminococcus callidus]|uniref:phage tail tape measure protein n=1 Tax=Ruminococcus callidus TaxID=40519 RepID=UPI0023F240D5|nr:phage tail tape measure protein [Ruminococcus callidus]
MADESIRVPIDGDTSGFDQKVEGMKGTISAASVAMGNLLSDMGKKALSAFGDMISSGDEFNKAINQMSSSTGATGAELEGLRDVVKDVYGNNFGDSYEDAANAVAEVTKQTGLMGEELQSATEGAMALSDTFGYEVNESTRAASALMNNFGISAEEAYNLIAAGAQNGADQNGDLLDTLNEYSTQYAALGLSAEQFTQSLISGAESGAFSIDRVGDAVKEFNIRCKDGSESTAEGFAMIGMNADDMAQRFAAGGDTAQEAFFQTVQALDSIADPVAKNQAAIDLFGTQFEDLQANLLPMLANMEDASGVAYDALGQINEVKYDDIGSAVEGLKRTVSGFSLDMKSTLSAGAEILNSIVQGISENASALLEAGQTLLNGIITAIQQALPNLLPIAVQLITTLINGLSEGLVALMEYVPQIILAIVNVIVENLPTLIVAAIEILNALVGGLMDNVSTILTAVIMIIMTLTDMIIQNLPLLIDAAIQIIMALVNGIVDNLPQLIEAAIDMIFAIVNGLIEQLPQLIDAAIQIVTALFQGLIDNLPMIIEAAIKLMYGLSSGLIKAIPDLLKAIPQIWGAIWDAITEVDWLELGGNILKGIANGLIEGVSAIWDTVQDVAGQIWDGFKDFFGINSPSKLMRDTVGKFLLPGVAVGMEDTTGDTADDLNRSLDAMMDKVDTDRLQMRLDSAVQMQGYSGLGAAGTAVQYNPPEKTAAEEYRQPQQNGDIIIPVNIGGTQLETVVVKAAQIANARSGGETL